MAKWVIRRTIDGRATSEPKYCAETRPFLRGTGVLAVADYVEELLEDGERVEPGAERRRIVCGDRIVGFIDVTDTHP
jgi:hypothetical protein